MGALPPTSLGGLFQCLAAVFIRSTCLLSSVSAEVWQVQTFVFWWKKGSPSAPLPHSSPLEHLPELQVGGIYVCVCACSSDEYSFLYIKIRVMKNIFLFGITVIYVKYFWVGTVSSTLSFWFLFFIYFNLIVFVAMSTSFSTALCLPSYEFYQIWRAESSNGCSGLWGTSAYLSPFLLSHSSTRSSCTIHVWPEGNTGRRLSGYESVFKPRFEEEDFSFISHLQNKEHLFLTLFVLCWSGSFNLQLQIPLLGNWFKYPIKYILLTFFLIDQGAVKLNPYNVWKKKKKFKWGSICVILFGPINGVTGNTGTR